MVIFKLRVIKLLFTLVVMFTTFFVVLTNEQIIVADSSNTYTPKYAPSPGPKRILGVLTNTAYVTQPQPDYYITAGDTLKIRTDIDWPFWYTPPLFTHYTWWQSTDGKSWSKASNSINGHKYLNLKTDISSPEITYYQLNTLFPIWSYASQVATVHVLPQPINATDIKIETDSNYLFNINNNIVNNKTIARAQKFPINSTEPVNWSTDRPDLATIDKDGVITANTVGNSGIVNVIGTIQNVDGTTVQGHKEINIGGGLTNQSVAFGKCATFKLQGTDENSRDETNGNITVKWYKQPSGQKKELVATENNPVGQIAYTTSKVTTKDNDSQYYAQIIVNNTKKSVTTRAATLTVLPPNDPDVQITTALSNRDFNINNTDTVINDVTSNDHLDYHLNLTNNSKRSIHDSYLLLPLHLNTSVDNIKVNNQEINPQDISTTTNNDRQQLKINLHNLVMHEKKTLDVSTTVGNITNRETFNSIPTLFGLDPDSDEYTSKDPELSINYLSNKLTASFKDINFEPITIFDHHQIKHRTYETNDPNAVITIDDQRRNRSHLKLFLKQLTPFKNDKGNILPADLRLYSNDSYQPTLNNKVLVSESTLGKIFQSVIWSHDDGLLLHIDKDHFLPGHYSSNLSWNIEDSV